MRGKTRTRGEEEEAEKETKNSPRVHVFHTHANVWLSEVSAVEADDVGAIAFVQDLQLSQNLLSHRRFRIDKDDFLRHDCIGLFVKHFRYRPTIAAAELREKREILVFQI